MDINYKQDQFELFPSTSPGSSEPQPQPRLMFSSITLSGENIIVLTVFVFLAIIVSFSFGVEKGKHVIARADSLTAQKVVANLPVVSKPAVVQRPVVATPRPQTVAVPMPRPQTVAVPIQRAPVKQVSSTIIAKANVSAPLLKIAPPTKEALGNFYTVQVASFKKQEFADQEANGLKKKGYEIFIVAKGQYLILCAGRFLDQGAAKVLSGKLKSKYKDCLVRRL